MKSFPITAFKLHRATVFPVLQNLEKITHVQASKEELLQYHKAMFAVRRVEVSCDQEYKARKIRGFCHLYDGQEAISTGTEAAITREDDWITTYRCHGVALARGCTPTEVFAEQFGYASGSSRGKGGSMHLYRKESHFYGGAAIVGAHVPIAAGLALFHKYISKDPLKTENASFVFYGDGAANQGQCWEAANMASLWKLPVVFVIENNQYGMGTAIQRSSALTEYFRQGGEVIPGIQVNGMDVLAVKTGMAAAKVFVTSGNGPIFVEAKTYRYHGHSMSDPGITYRSREEVAKTRAERDPIEMVKSRIIDAGFATADELKEVERQVRDQVQQSLAEALAGKAPDTKELVTDMYTDGEQDKGDSRYRMKSWYPSSVRMPDRMKSHTYNN